MTAPASIVVVGASAGGLHPLLRVVSALAPDLPAAVFVARHHPPRVVSELPGILGRATPLPVVVAEDAAKIEAGTIYVAPSGRHLLVEPGRVVVSVGPPDGSFRPSVDTLFRSAAHAYGPRAIGVVLSGAAGDGARGLLSIERAGGVAIVQRPTEAQFPAMPREAIAHVSTVHVLPAAEVGPMIGHLVAGLPVPPRSFPGPTRGRGGRA